MPAAMLFNRVESPFVDDELKRTSATSGRV
jgi:hypothetical protein